jgi:hypothetical protein
MEGGLSTVAQRVGAAVVERQLVPSGTTLVFVSVTDDLSQQYANYLKLHRVV